MVVLMECIIIYQIICTCVTGLWKTDCDITLGLFHFIAPANIHTHTLPAHCCIVGFANHVKSRLGQWGSWRALDGTYGSDIHPVLVRHLLCPLGLSGYMISTSWTHSYYKQSYCRV